MGEDGREEYHSMVHYHTNMPVWNEIVKVNIDSVDYSSSHLKFYFAHCSSSSER